MGKLDYATLMKGDAKEKLNEIPENSVHVCITSPPYWGLRDYNENGQLGLEETPQKYVENLVDVFQEVKRVLHPSGTFWLNMGDSYNGSGGTGTKPNLRPDQEKHGAPPTRYEGLKPKDLCLMPSRVALSLQDDGWWVRQEVIWAKGISFCQEYSGTCMPESVNDRATQSHEKLFHFSKSKNYFYDIDAVREDYQSKKRDIDRAHITGRGDQDYSQAFIGSDQRDKSGGYPFNNEGRNLRSVWTINPSQFSDAHFACVDEETEILSETGWKSFESLTEEDKIATLNPDTETIHYHKPYSIKSYEYEGEMYHIENKWVDQLVTPNHRVLKKYQHNGWIDDEWNYQKAEKLRPHSAIQIPNSGYYKSKNQLKKEKAELLGWIITEGSNNNGSVKIWQSYSANPKKVERIERLLEKTSQNFALHERKRQRKHGLSVENNFALNKTENNNDWIFNWLNEDLTPKWKLLHINHESLLSLYQGIIGGDGNKHDDGKHTFYQNKRGVHEWFRILCTHIGKRTTFWKSGDRKQTNITHQNFSKIWSQDFDRMVNKEFYEGIVWCPQVPNTNFIAKRNEKIFITGNTFPLELVEPPVKAGSSAGGVCSSCKEPLKRKDKNDWEKTCDCKNESIERATVLDPFMGAGTVGIAALKHERKFIGIDINEEYVEMARKRILKHKEVPMQHEWW